MTRKLYALFGLVIVVCTLLFFSSGVFAQEKGGRVSLNVTVLPESAGDVSGVGDYLYGEIGSLKATPKDGFIFKQWRGATVSNPKGERTMIYMDRNINLYAEFDYIRHVVGVSIDPEGTGHISGTGLYRDGDTVILTAVPALGYEFSGWGGLEESVIAESISFPVKSPVTLVAKFSKEKEYYRLNMSAFPPEGGTVETPGVYQEGMVNVKAIPNEGYIFSHWTGSDVIHDSELNESVMNLRKNTDMSAHFIREKVFVRAEGFPMGSGHVRGQGFYQIGDVVSLTAVANPGYVFSEWRGLVDDSKSPNTTMKIGGNEKNVAVAVFVLAK